MEAALQLPVVSEIVTGHGVVVDWSAGVVAADLVGYLGARHTERDVRLSSTLGVGKGVVAIAVGAVALANNEVIFAEIVRQAPDVAAFVREYLGGPTAFSFAVGVWVGTVVGELAEL